MNRLLALLTVALFAGVAVADVPPPPPPKGKKYASVTNEVRLGKDVTGYAFVERVTNFTPGPQPPTYRKVALSADRATPMAAGGRRTAVGLLAVPQDAAKEFKTDAELLDALKANKVKGVSSLDFRSTAVVPDTVKGNSVKWTYTITGIDAKGITAKVEGEGAEQSKPRPGKQDAPEEGEDSPGEDVPAALAPRGGVWVAGVAAALGVMLGGLWLAGRARRK